MATFGNTVGAGVGGNTFANVTIYLRVITTDSNWNRLDSMTCTIAKASTTTPCSYDFAVYANRVIGGLPGTSLAVTGSTIATATRVPVTLNFTGSNQIILAPNTEYWIGIRCNSSADGFFLSTSTTGTSASKVQSNTVLTWPITNRDVSTTTRSNNLTCIYITTTVVSAPKTGGAMTFLTT